ncbi:alpha/beta hydrolase [Desulfurispira natronophila]|uniref:Esterase/lipase n=1 Tax=Desulfurispira natronophila TaxID=682562 RepID=A0A7W7Y4W0_9BACT|nr:alpha/beta fold hydrolase [Desulfurispira natronophila]MBB5021984.1 esterase/lipase [Desulfurispira natronophila]
MKKNLLILFTTLLCAIAAALLWKYMQPVPPRLLPTDHHTGSPPSADTPFAEYLAQTRAMIVDVHQTMPHKKTLDKELLEFSIEANAPFEIPPSSQCPKVNGKAEKGILLVHGLTDSPYSMVALGKHLAQRCFLVRTVLLPGHGTVPGDLLDIDYQQWIGTVEYGLHQLNQDAHQVFMGGYSTGGTLAIQQALEGMTPLQGLILIAPAIAIDSPFARALPAVTRLASWLRKADDADLVKYESFAFNAALQVQRLIEHNQMLLHHRPVSVPLFIAATADDATVSTWHTQQFFAEQAPHPHSRLLLFQKSQTDSFDAEQRTWVFNSYLPQQNIYHFSHISLPYPPDDPHYGKDGRYRNCLHYSDADDVKRCRKSFNAWSGEVFIRDSKQGYALRRLTYNPRFDDMLNQIDKWLELFDQQETPPPSTARESVSG